MQKQPSKSTVSADARATDPRRLGDAPTNGTRESTAGRWLGRAALAAVTASASLALAIGCEGGDGPGEYGGLGWGTFSPIGIDAGANAKAGSPCEMPGEKVECGYVTERYGDYVTCSLGYRTCTDGLWGPCIGKRTTQRKLQEAQEGARLQALGNTSGCGADDEICNPYCHHIEDTPGDFTVGPEFSNTEDGLTPVQTGVGGCTSLTLTPSTSTITANAISGTIASNVTFTLTATPSGCIESPFATTWSVDKVDRATISGTSNTNGKLTLAVPISGTLKVTAYAAALSASVDIDVKVNALDAPTSTSAASPNKYASSSQRSAFGNATSPNVPSTASTATWLYPYENTYFPLGLPAPAILYRYSNSGGGGGAVKVSLRYPVGEKATTAAFNYSLIVKEENVISQSAGVGSNTLDPQVVIPQAAWTAFEQAARGNDAELIIQRYRGNNVLETENRRVIYFVDGQLKGTVYYNSYTSPQGGNTGAVLKISPGATSPTLAVQPSGKCTVCHTVNNEGTRLIANGPRPSGGVTFNNSRRYDITKAGPSPTVLNDYNASGGDVENESGDRFTFGGPWLNGDLYMTHGGKPGGGDDNWRAPPAVSTLRKVTSPGTAITVTNWPSNMQAVTPRFSNDGKKLAFGFWQGDALKQTPSGTLSSNSSGRRLAVVDFWCGSTNCNSSSTGWKVTNARDLTPGFTEKVAWPSFTPDGDSVLYQRQYRTSQSKGNGGVLTNNWSPSDINTVAGALAEIWMSNVPPDKNTAAVPTRLNALNGLNPDGSSYLPQEARVVSPVPTAYHKDNASFTIAQADNCSNTGTAKNVYNYRLNYLPYVSPVEVGGYHWVVFTSRRMYGNVAFDDPWDAEPGFTCHSGQPPTKKLWIAAIDKDWTPGKDPSHPAFYFPGQELKAGNSDGYWVNAQCVGTNGTCTSNDDCCGGTGDEPTMACKVVSTGTPPARQCRAIDSCSTPGGACASSSDCCSGLTCGSGTCFDEPDPVYETQSLERDYSASCADGTIPVWRFFEWKADVPSGATIQFGVQTRSSASGAWQPETPLSMAEAQHVPNLDPDQWVHGDATADDVLHSAGYASGLQLRVTMTFNPNAAGTAAPTLKSWRQLFDCVPGE